MGYKKQEWGNAGGQGSSHLGGQTLNCQLLMPDRRRSHPSQSLWSPCWVWLSPKQGLCGGEIDGQVPASSFPTTSNSVMIPSASSFSAIFMNFAFCFLLRYAGAFTSLNGTCNSCALRCSICSFVKWDLSFAIRRSIGSLCLDIFFTPFQKIFIYGIIFNLSSILLRFCGSLFYPPHLYPGGVIGVYYSPAT